MGSATVDSTAAASSDFNHRLLGLAYLNLR